MAVRTFREFDAAALTRDETLALVQELDQEQSERHPRPGVWSVGEILDHLVKLDAIIIHELDIALDRGGHGLPFVYRSLADIDPDMVPRLARPFMPLFEVPFSMANAVVPQRLRRLLTGSRKIPVAAPNVLQPRRGRPIEELRSELGATFATIARLQREHPDMDLEHVYYYNPITGLNNIPGMYKFTANHEKRHQAQLREVLAEL